MNKKPLVSIVIPMYNLEDYVQTCFEALRNQTVFNECEIVCVDDGSTDSTGEKLDSLAQDCPQLKVFHQSNRGQSSARNKGIAEAEGEWICFVDGDDLFCPQYVETLIKYRRPDSIVCCKHEVVSNYVAPRETGTGDEHYISQKEAFRLFLLNEIEEGPYCKLFPRKLMGDNPFPEGRQFEDLAAMGRFILNTDGCVLVDKVIYSYVMRPGSTIHPKACSITKPLDYIRAVDEVEGYSLASYPELALEVNYRRFLSYMRMRPFLKVVEDDGAKASSLMDEQISFAKANVKSLVQLAPSKSQRLRMFLFAKCPAAYDAAMSLYDKCLRGR